MKIWDAFVAIERGKMPLNFSHAFLPHRGVVIDFVRPILEQRRRPVRIDCQSIRSHYNDLASAAKLLDFTNVCSLPAEELFLDFGHAVTGVGASYGVLVQQLSNPTEYNALGFMLDEIEKQLVAFFIMNCDGPIYRLWRKGNEEEVWGADAYARMALLSLSLLNCRNIELVDYKIPPALARSQAKKGHLPKLDFKTIHIKGFSTTEIGRPKSEKSEPLLPKHIVLGHMRTYTEQRPLFGKHVGTFWVPQHHRGDVKNGIVVKDYVLER